jgi:hypothetical protein
MEVHDDPIREVREAGYLLIGNDEKERAGMRIAREGEPSTDPEEIEACPVETIIRIWRHGLQGRSSQDSFPPAHSNVD